jgi:hypothetical protein
MQLIAWEDLIKNCIHMHYEHEWFHVCVRAHETMKLNSQQNLIYGIVSNLETTWHFPT